MSTAGTCVRWMAEMAIRPRWRSKAAIGNLNAGIGRPHLSAAQAVIAQRRERFMTLPGCTGFQSSECKMELFPGIGSEVRTRALGSYSLGARRSFVGRVFSGA